VKVYLGRETGPKLLPPSTPAGSADFRVRAECQIELILRPSRFHYALLEDFNQRDLEARREGSRQDLLTLSRQLGLVAKGAPGEPIDLDRSS
jgi:hypothetical protein